ncbi:MAG: PAS domain S-box protein [Deltaproteobacteria bacterium]|nr:PAS domain S-box protein [Deltaproteobacteria bacterium]
MVDRDKQPGSLDRQQVFRSLYLHMVEAVALSELVCDETGQPVNYRILDANPQFRRCFAGEDRAIAGRLATEVFATVEPPLLADLAPVALGGQAVRFAGRIDASGRFYDISVVPLGEGHFAMILLDITERRRGEAALRFSEEIFRRIFDLFPGPITLAETDGTIINCNEEFCRAIGYTRAEIIGRKTTTFSTWLDPAQRALMYARLSQGQPVDWLEFKMRQRDGQVRTMQISGRPFELAGRTVVLAVGRDITELRHLEQQMLHSQKLESLGVLAGGIAHDFNNLLTGILGNADLARSEMSPLAPARASLEGIESAARRAADLCRQLLAYSGRGRFLVEPISMPELVEEMGHLLQVSISKRVVLKYHFAKGLPAVDADATQLRQVVMNLIVNASEAIGERSGVISVTVGLAHCDADYLEGCLGADNLQPGDFVYLEVADTGHGIEAADLNRIFDPFFSTKFTGRGLGLAAVLGIVRGHRGAIRVYSESGKGTTFKLLFPASESGAREPEVKPAPAAAPQTTGTVLLADDEETIRSLGRRMLRAAGFQVIIAADGREAIEKFVANMKDIDVVVLDLTMPHSDGEACFRELRQLKPGVKVILSSGYNEQDIVNRFAGKGLAGFVQKPYTGSELLAKIHEVLGK